MRNLAVALACAALSIGLAAQTDRVQLRLVPAPDQSIQFHLTQEFTFGPAAQADADSRGLIPNVSLTSKVAFTQTTGHPDEEGRVTAQVTWDEASVTTTMDGKSTPMSGLSHLLGRQTTATYDRQGKLVDLQPPPELAAQMEPMRQMLSAVFAGMPVDALAIGESASVPFNFYLPVKGAGMPAMNGKTTFTLRSIRQEGADRIAHYDELMELSSEVNPLPGANGTAGGMTVAFQMKGAGTMDYNVERGIAVANDMRGTMDVKTRFTGDQPTGLPSLNMHGTIKMTLASTYQ
jgi:hypothetical protein